MYRNQHQECTPGESAAPAARFSLASTKPGSCVLSLGKIGSINSTLGKKERLESRIGLKKPQSIMGFLKTSIRNNKNIIDFDITDELASLKSTQGSALSVCRIESAPII